MEHIKNDAYYLKKLRADMVFIVKHMAGVDAAGFQSNEVLQDSMMFRLIQISENAEKISEKYKTKHSGLPWKELRGLRNRIVHDYGHVDLTIIYETVKNDIPKVCRILEMLDKMQ